MSDDDDEGVYIRSADRQRILKQRDESYRKFLIEESKRVEPKWDSFEEEEDEEENEDNKPKAKKEKKKKKKAPEARKRKADDNDEDEEGKDEQEEEVVEPEQPPEKVPKFKAAKEEGAVPQPPKKKLKKKRARSQGKNTRDKIQEPNPRDSTESSGIVSPTDAVTDPSLFINTQMMCLGCREKGHRLKNCPKFKSNVCIKCGATDHKYLNCPTGGDFKFAVCFVCKETVSGRGITFLL